MPASSVQQQEVRQLSTTDAPEEGAQRKPFAAFVHEQRNGSLHGELSHALHDLVAAVSEHGKKGSLTLQVVVEPMGDGTTVRVSDKIKLALPDPERGAAIFFVDHDGNLTRKNPAQIELPLREVGERKAGEV